MKSTLHWKSFILLALLGFITGCNTKNQQTGTLTQASASYLIFSGDTVNATVAIDDRAFALTPENAKNHFEIAPGVHRIKITKDGRVVVDREILLNDRQTVEVAVP